MRERVAIGTTVPRYNDVPPFHPAESFPELPFRDVSPQPNDPYRLLRDLLRGLGYDAARYGRREWNPLGALIQPGQTVLLKPNFVLSFHTGSGDLFSIITHPSVLRALMDYVYVALKGRGRIIIADAPQMDCGWQQLMAAQRLDTVQAFYRDRFNFDIELYDLRNFELIDPRQPAYSENRRPLAGDPQGATIVNLGERSAFFGLPDANYYGADFDRAETVRHHHDRTHEYSVSKTVLAADVLISVPKMKVHKKVGVTLNIKGLVGINTNKNYLIHYRVGSPRDGGDQIPDDIAGGDRWLVKTQRWFFDHALAKQTRTGDWAYQLARGVYRTLIKPFRQVTEYTAVVDGGNWHGNDSAWRMAADLAKIVYFANAEGKIQATPQRKFLCVVDGILGGENAGPLAPDAKPAGCLVVGENPLAVDLVTTRLMGFDETKLRQFSIGADPAWNFGLRTWDDIEVLGTPDLNLHFRPHPGWVGHVERPTAP